MIVAQLQHELQAAVVALRRNFLRKRYLGRLARERGITHIHQRQVVAPLRGIVVLTSRDRVQLIECCSVRVLSDDGEYEKLLVGFYGATILDEPVVTLLRLAAHSGITPGAEVGEQRTAQLLDIGSLP